MTGAGRAIRKTLMDLWKGPLLAALLKPLDLAVLILAFLFAATVESAQFQSLTLAQFLEMRLKVENFILFSALAGLWHLLLCACDLYPPRRPLGEPKDVAACMKAGAAVTGATAAFASLCDIGLVTPLFTAVFLAASGPALAASRMILRLLLRHGRRRPAARAHVLIAGTNPRAIEIARRLEASLAPAYRLLGFVEADRREASRVERLGYTVLADFTGLADYLRHHVVDEIILALPLKSMYEQAEEVFRAAADQGIVVRLAGDLFPISRDKAQGEFLGDLPVVSYYPGVAPGIALAVKRSLDILLSALLLAAALPLFLLIALLIVLDSPGPVLFAQERVGLNKRPIRMLKFRTMVADAERRQQELEAENEAGGPVFKIAADPRVTRIGRLLRRSSLDELPQLLNVLKGEMSLVGPRPLPLRDYRGFREDWHRRRLSVKPGITGLWQVAGRSTLSFERWMRLDLEYIDRWSLWLDVKILFRTIPAVLSGRGAL